MNETILTEKILQCCGNCIHFKPGYVSDYYGDDVYGCEQQLKILSPHSVCNNWEFDNITERGRVDG